MNTTVYVITLIVGFALFAVGTVGLGRSLTKVPELPPGYHIVTDGETFRYVDDSGHRNALDYSTLRDAARAARWSYDYCRDTSYPEFLKEYRAQLERKEKAVWKEVKP